MRKIFLFLAACERMVERNPGESQTADAVLRLLVQVTQWGCELRERTDRVHKQQRGIGHDLVHGKEFPVCAHRSGPLHTDSRELQKNISIGGIEFANKLHELDNERCRLESEWTLHRQAVQGVLELRRKFLMILGERRDNASRSLVYRPESLHHAAVISMIQASQCDDKWNDVNSTWNHFDGVHGHVVNAVSKVKGRIPRNLELRERNETTRVSRRKGESAWNTVGVHSVPVRQYGTLFESLADKSLQTGKPLYRLWQKLQGRTEDRTEEVYPTQDKARMLLKTARLLRESGHNPEQQRVFRRLKLHVSGTTSGVTQFTVSRVEIVQAGISPESTLTANNTTMLFEGIRLSVWCCKVVTTYGESWEYGFCKLPDEVPAECRRILENVQTYHASDSVLLSGIVDILLDRLRTAANNYHARTQFSGRESAEQSRKRLRNCKASYLAKLRRIPEISLQDSYNVGNCVPGTRQFCQELGIDSETIPGDTMARKWRSAGYPMNELFFRVVNKLSSVQTAGGVK